MRLVSHRTRPPASENRVSRHMQRTQGVSTGGQAGQEKRGPPVRNRKQYPPEWPALALACKTRAGWQCEHCGVKHGSWRKSKRTGRKYRVWMQAAHKDHRERGCKDATLLCLCFTCHARMDYAAAQRLADSRLRCLKHRHLLAKSGYAPARAARS